jgi:hypothetical protein
MVSNHERSAREVVVDLEAELFFEGEGRDDFQLCCEVSILSRFEPILLAESTRVVNTPVSIH